MGRPPIRKSGAMTATERQQRWRKKVRQRLKTEPRRRRRAEREQELAERTIAASAALGTKLYGVLYVDPPWRYEVYSRETGMNRAAENHYPTMTLDELLALPIPAAPDCALFMWSTAPMLRNAIRLMEAWGFDYKSEIVWVKDKIGLGHWSRSQHEPLLIGSRGTIPAPTPGDQVPSVLFAPRSEHSEKPEAIAEMIGKLYPNTPRLEMFARRSRPGWDRWGNEAGGNHAE